MDRSVLVDETAYRNTLDWIQHKSEDTDHVGLLIGKSSKEVVLYCCPTPPQYEEEEPTENLSVNSKSSTRLSESSRYGQSPILDSDWIVEHAAQVVKMLIGGIEILGIFVYCSDLTLKTSQGPIVQTLLAIQKLGHGLPKDQSRQNQESLLLHISRATKKHTFRSCTSRKDLRVRESRLGRFLDNLHLFSTSYSVDLQLEVDNQSMASLGKLTSDGFQKEISKILLAETMSNGKLVPPLVELPAKPLSLGLPQKVDLLLPMNQQAASCLPDSKPASSIVGMVEVKGTIQAFSFAYSRESNKAAMADLKKDVVRSLTLRMDVQLSDADVNADSLLHPINTVIDEGNRRIPCGFVMARRVLVPTSNYFYFCDYLLPEETMTDVKERCRSLLGDYILFDNIHTVETPYADIQSVNEVKVERAEGKQPDSKGLTTFSISHYSLLVILLALVVGYIVNKFFH